MPIALPFPDLLSQSYSEEPQDFVDVVQFDDGYADIQPRGINSQLLLANFAYTPLTLAQANTVRDALKLIGVHDYFTFTPKDTAQVLKFRVIAGSKRYTYPADLCVISFQALQRP